LSSDLVEQKINPGANTQKKGAHDPSIRVPRGYLTSDSHVGPTAWAHFDKCLRTPSAQAGDTYRCPICERHRKLYGYRWPKTKQKGRRDNEEQVYSLSS
jgi:hypothetical protein